MKKIFLVVSFLICLSVTGLFADTWSPTLILSGFVSRFGTDGNGVTNSWGQYSCYYDSSAKSMVISIEYEKDASHNRNTISLAENTNPKLFAYLKDAIEKCLGSHNGVNAPQGSVFYSNIAFRYDSSNNRISGFRFYYND